MGLGVRSQRLPTACFCNTLTMYFTVVLKLDPARLYATYFGGDDKLGLPADRYTHLPLCV